MHILACMISCFTHPDNMPGSPFCPIQFRKKKFRCIYLLIPQHIVFVTYHIGGKSSSCYIVVSGAPAIRTVPEEEACIYFSERW